MRQKFSPRWKTQKLDQLGFVGRGRSRHRPRNDPSLYGGEYPFFQTGDIKNANLYLSEYSQTYNETGLAQSKQWEPETLCITIAANIADTAILGIRGCFPDSVIGFIADPAKADVRFIKYYIDLIKLDMQQVSHGTTQDNLSLDKLLRFDFVVPNVKEQRKIAAILSAYDDLIENNLRRIKILEEMAQNLYREWFVKFRFPGHEKTRFVDSPLGQIPEGWEIKRLDQVVLFQNKGTEAGKHLRDLIYLPIDCIPRKSLAISEINSWEEAKSSLHLFDEGDILFGAMRPYFHKVVVAPFKGVTRKTCFVFKSALPEYHAFAALTLFQDATVSFANAHSKGATIPYAVWPQSMDGMPLIVPPIRQAEKYEVAVSPMISRIGIMYFQNSTLRRTRDLLLPKLISGEVDVSELDITVPEEASA